MSISCILFSSVKSFNRLSISLARTIAFVYNTRAGEALLDSSTKCELKDLLAVTFSTSFE